MYDLAYYQIAPRFYRLQGVAQARVTGGRPPEMHVLVQPDKLNGYNLPLSKVVDALRNSNVISASGLVTGKPSSVSDHGNGLPATRRRSRIPSCRS